MIKTDNNLRQSKLAGAFTLVEIMLALGVLGIGMVLVATLFPPAVMQAKKADQNTLSIIISDNARAILDTRINFINDNVGVHKILTHTDTHGTSGVDVSANHRYDEATNFEFMEIPIGDNVTSSNDNNLGQLDGDIIHFHDSLYSPRENAGWRALVRCIEPPATGNNEYQFVVIPYIMPPTIDASAENQNFRQAWDDEDETYLVHVWDEGGSEHGSSTLGADTPVTIRQTEFDGTVLLVEKQGANYSDFKWMAIGSPVLLDGRNNDDVNFLGSCLYITDIGEWEDDPNYVACQLSGTLFDSRHPDYGLLDEDGDGDFWNDIEVDDRGIWVFRGENFAGQSPAIGAYVYGSIIE